MRVFKALSLSLKMSYNLILHYVMCQACLYKKVLAVQFAVQICPKFTNQPAKKL